MNTLEELKEKIKNDQEWQKFIDELGIVVKPMFKRILIKEAQWITKIVSKDNMVLSLDHNPNKPEKERGERPSYELARYTIVAVSDDCDANFAPGMDIAIMPQEGMGFSTKIRVPNKDGKDVQVYSVIMEHEALFIIIDDRLKELQFDPKTFRDNVILNTEKQEEHLDTGGDIVMGEDLNN